MNNEIWSLEFGEHIFNVNCKSEGCSTEDDLILSQVPRQVSIDTSRFAAIGGMNSDKKALL